MPSNLLRRQTVMMAKDRGPTGRCNGRDPRLRSGARCCWINGQLLRSNGGFEHICLA